MSIFFPFLLTKRQVNSSTVAEINWKHSWLFGKTPSSRLMSCFKVLRQAMKKDDYDSLWLEKLLFNLVPQSWTDEETICLQSLSLLMLMSQPECDSRHYPFGSNGLSLDSFQGWERLRVRGKKKIPPSLTCSCFGRKTKESRGWGKDTEKKSSRRRRERERSTQRNRNPLKSPGLKKRHSFFFQTMLLKKQKQKQKKKHRKEWEERSAISNIEKSI